MAEPTRELRLWRGELEDKLKHIHQQQADLQVDEVSTTRQMRLIDELLSGGEAAVGFRLALRQVFNEQARPLRLTELRSLLEEKGQSIPGKGTDANLIAHLRRMPGVQRVDRGTYAADGTAIAVEPKGKAKPRKRRKRRKSAHVIAPQTRSNG